MSDFKIESNVLGRISSLEEILDPKFSVDFYKPKPTHAPRRAAYTEDLALSGRVMLSHLERKIADFKPVLQAASWVENFSNQAAMFDDVTVQAILRSFDYVKSVPLVGATKDTGIAWEGSRVQLPPAVSSALIGEEGYSHIAISADLGLREVQPVIINTMIAGMLGQYFEGTTAVTPQHIIDLTARLGLESSPIPEQITLSYAVVDGVKVKALALS